MIKNEVIELSNSPYAFNIVIVGKKNGVGKGMDRMCINFLLLNNIIKRIVDQYLL